MKFDLEKNSRTSKQHAKKRRLLWFIVIPLLIVTLGSGSYFFHLYSKAKSIVNNAYLELNRGDKSNKREKAVKPMTDNISVLIMGVDESDIREKNYGKATRTDALLLATINKNDKSVKLVSIPRDSRVYIKSRHKKDKITHAHVFGGVDSTIDTVERFLNVPVDYYVKFNFTSFIKIVDSLGGITVDVPVEFTEQNSKDEAEAIHLKKGRQHLNGEEALALARTRHIDSDYMRGQRQQLVLEAIAQKALSINSINKLGSLLDAVDRDLKTNLTFDDMMTITKHSMGSDLKMDKLQVKGSDKYIDGIYYYVPDEKSVQNISVTLQKHLEVTNKSEHKKL
ncbi:LCP family protein [Bacillus cytotoxicus]|uniref:Cell envelope-related transcriptional attenuator n=2 Tax=Bacillus cytotoxicus TaxID=580165 RepID=A0AAX2CCM4_9BACI|nr:MULTISPECIES: LCP family protein [Bacillus cereus group]ABS20876.1 cell envelope-related transcriptional attenuator [Bacillus cytotoxicus NVH 391-98]AWC27511.1 LytR family transcriptional regulator [Bacillus cytotoxicus]AWC31524.1 LytR family transcriptional regulator [Bacillus cytotoxicus]AWC35564.1 LytR family transcriptional regulator [Bacillus cytotoxicus]AWC41114.1 LytR family transcriptional regulator [Bacillus cytotoxicus]